MREVPDKGFNQTCAPEQKPETNEFMKDKNIFAAVTVKSCTVNNQPVREGDVVLVCADTFRNLGETGKKKLRAATAEETAKAKAAREAAAEAADEEAEAPKEKPGKGAKK
jgi:hypothetical protein